MSRSYIFQNTNTFTYRYIWDLRHTRACGSWIRIPYSHKVSYVSNWPQKGSIRSLGFNFMDGDHANMVQVVSAALSERKVAGSILMIGDFHTVGPCKKAVFACLVNNVKQETFTLNRRNFRKCKNFVTLVFANFQTLKIFIQQGRCHVQCESAWVLCV